MLQQAQFCVLLLNRISLQSLILSQPCSHTLGLYESIIHSCLSPSLAVSTVQEQWGHLEEMELVNDGSGLGFGIVGGKATGVVVRTLVPNSVADKVN